MPDLIKCPICNFESENLTTHIRNHGMTVKDFKKQFGLKYVQSDRLRATHSANIDKNNPTKGKGHSPTAIEKMSKNRAGIGIGYVGKYERTPEIRQKISEGVIEAHFRGDFDHVKPGTSSFVYSDKMQKAIFARSTWEAIIIDVLDKHPRVVSFVEEPFSIPYMFNGAQHRYIPDFLVKYDECIDSIWEVKRDDFIEGDAKTVVKLTALDEYCKSHNMNMFVIDSKILKRLKQYTEQL